VLKIEHVIRDPFMGLVYTNHHRVLDDIAIHKVVEASTEKDTRSNGGVASMLLLFSPLRGGEIADGNEWSRRLDLTLLGNGIEKRPIDTCWSLKRRCILLGKDFLCRAP
jgi:hypothetical protein